MAAAPRSVGQRRRVGIALGIYLLLTVVFFATAPRERLLGHSPYNHYALLADAWLHGRLDLGGPPPAYTANNDFAERDGKYYVSFPPFPAVLITPIVALAHRPERVRDGQFFLWLAGIGPAVLFLALEKLRRKGRSERSEVTHAALALLFGLGTVYWFCAVEGTVWFAAHVVGVALTALYILFSIDADRPVLAGLMLGLGVATRTSLLFAVPWFAYEAFRAANLAPAAGSARRFWPGFDGASMRAFARQTALFLAPLLLVGLALAWHNYTRFGDPTEFGHRLLQVVWRKRINEWGLFSYHYLGRNLGVVLTSLPYYSAKSGLQVNGHGLGLWVTTPVLLWVLWPKRANATYWALGITAAAVALPCLLYQNTGWLQFGYRFSNDFAPFLFVMLALGRCRFGALFWLAAAWGVAINAFGAVTFGRADYQHYYFVEGSQRVLYQPD